MREEDLVTRRWMGDGKVEDTTIFLLSDNMNVNSLHKVGGNMYGLAIQSNATRDAGAYNICQERGTIACLMPLTNTLVMTNMLQTFRLVCYCLQAFISNDYNHTRNHIYQ